MRLIILLIIYPIFVLFFPGSGYFVILNTWDRNSALFTKVSVIFQVKFATLDVNIDIVNIFLLNCLKI